MSTVLSCLKDIVIGINGSLNNDRRYNVQGGRQRRSTAGLRYRRGNVCGLVPGPGNGTEPRPVSSRVLPSRHVSELAVDDNDRRPFYRQTNKCFITR